MSLWNEFRLTRSRRGLAGLHRKVVLTYDNTKMADGVGAQLQRVYGIYSISRLLGASYLHTPVGRVNYQGLPTLEDDVADPIFHDEFNDLLQLKSDIAPTDEFHKIKLPNISLKTLGQLVATFHRNGADGTPILLQLLLPYGIADCFPDCYEVCKEVSPFASSGREGRALRIAIHVRWGDLLVVDSHRMLPNSYYVNVAQKVAQVLERLKFDYQIELHTEVPKKEFVVQPDGHRISAPRMVSPEMCRLDEFNVLPNLVPCINEAAIDCLRKLATADILIMSRSSFSYLAGILNKSGAILYYPFWHSALSSWIPTVPSGEFNPSRLIKAAKF